MKYARFKQLWDALVTNRIHSPERMAATLPFTGEMSPNTSQALIEFGMYGTGPFVGIKDRIAAAKARAAQAPA